MCCDLSIKLGGVTEVTGTQPFPVQASAGGSGGHADPGLLLWSTRLVGQQAGGQEQTHRVSTTAVTLRSRVQRKEGTTSCLRRRPW